MRIVHILILVVSLGIAGSLSAGGQSSAAATIIQKADSSSVKPQDQTSLAKTRNVKPVSKTNWSKIKDLFM
jgi:hypothetical protein